MSVVLDEMWLPSATIDGVRYSSDDVRRMLLATKKCKASRQPAPRPGPLHGRHTRARPIPEFDSCACCQLAVTVLRVLGLR